MTGQGLQKNSSSYLQARANGFGAPGQGRPRTKTEELTDKIDDMAIEHGDELTAMSLQVFKDGMRTGDMKDRLNAAKAWMTHFHHPSKQIDMNVNEQVTISTAAREAADGLTPEEQAIMGEVHARLMAMRDAVLAEAVSTDIEGDVITVQAEVVAEETPPPTPAPLPSLPPPPPPPAEPHT